MRRQEVFDFLRQSPGTERFQIIFADPPYEKTSSGERFIEKLLKSEALAQLLEPNGVFVLEKRPSAQTPVTMLWDIIRAKKYGSTEVLFLSAIRDPQSAI